jgi:hypothetical protein
MASQCARPILNASWREGRKAFFVNPFERGEVGPDLFRAACNMDLEGLVSKRRDCPYKAGRAKHRVKVKNRKHPAMSRVMEAFACSRPFRLRSRMSGTVAGALRFTERHTPLQRRCVYPLILT